MLEYVPISLYSFLRKCKPYTLRISYLGRILHNLFSIALHEDLLWKVSLTRHTTSHRRMADDPPSPSASCDGHSLLPRYGRFCSSAGGYNHRLHEDGSRPGRNHVGQYLPPQPSDYSQQYRLTAPESPNSPPPDY